MQEARRRLGLPIDAFIVGYSAQDTFFDLDPLFDGVRRLVDAGINVMIVMSGHAPPGVKRSIARFGLEMRARFLGYLSWGDYPWCLSSCGAFACPFPPTVYITSAVGPESSVNTAPLCAPWCLIPTTISPTLRPAITCHIACAFDAAAFARGLPQAARVAGLMRTSRRDSTVSSSVRI
jgi:hypothetical protein